MIDQLNKQYAAEKATTAKARPPVEQPHIEEITQESIKRIQNAKRLYLKNVQNEEEIKNIFRNVLGRTAKIDEIIKIPKAGSVTVKDTSEAFIVNLETERETRDIIKKKYDYFKNNASKVAINLARTKRQRESNRNSDGHDKKRMRNDDLPTSTPSQFTSRYDVENASPQRSDIHGVNDTSPAFHGFDVSGAGRSKKVRPTRKVGRYIR